MSVNTAIFTDADIQAIRMHKRFVFFKRSDDAIMPICGTAAGVPYKNPSAAYCIRRRYRYISGRYLFPTIVDVELKLGCILSNIIYSEHTERGMIKYDR